MEDIDIVKRKPEPILSYIRAIGGTFKSNGPTLMEAPRGLPRGALTAERGVDHEAGPRFASRFEACPGSRNTMTTSVQAPSGH